MSRTASIDAANQSFEVKYRDGNRGFKMHISFVPDDEAKIESSETGKYYTETHVSVNLPDGVDTPYSRQELTLDVIEAAVDGWVERYEEAENHTVRRITEVEIFERRNARRLDPDE